MGRRQMWNTAIAAIMELCNALQRFRPEGEAEHGLMHEAWEAVVRMIAPVAPHISEALWRKLGGEHSVFSAGWPEVDKTALERAAVTLVVQVNGRARGRLEVAPGIDRASALAWAAGGAQWARP